MTSANAETPGGTDPVGALVGSLAVDEEIVRETVAAIRATVPGYEGVPAASLEESTRRNRDLSIRTIRDDRAPDADLIEAADALTAERMSQGVPIGSVLSGFRVCMSVILRHLLDAAPRYGIPAERALSFSTLLWTLGDAFTTRAVVVDRDRTVAQAVADSARRAQWIGSAVVGGLDGAELPAGAAIHGVPRDRPVRALCGDVPAGEPAEHSGRLEEWAARAGARALVAPRGRGVVGILVGQPDPGTDLDGGTVAMGPPVALGELPASFEVAVRVLAAAHRVEVDGVVDVDRLSWRMGIFTSPETTAALHDRHLAPLRSEGAFGELLVEALAAYLEHRLSIPRAAGSIPVHVNTLRYRLQRYQELTGADLKDLDTLIEISWALAARRGAAAPGSAGPPIRPSS
jgi:putative transposase